MSDEIETFGAGFGPAGAYPAGTPYIIYPSKDRRIFVDSNNEVQNSRYINPTTKDYELSPNGNIKGMSGIQQLVLLALTTDLGSSSQTNLGNLLSSIKVIGPATKTNATNFVSSALSNLINNNQISLEKVDVQIQSTRILIQILWLDLTQNRAFTSLLSSQGLITNER